MESLFLAKVLGVYTILVCLSVLINRRRFRAMIERTEGNSLSMYVSGALILILGLFLVNVHNIWAADYRGVITFFIWLTLFKGAVRVFFPEEAVKWGKSAFHAWWYMPLVAVFLVVGVWLTSVGYGWM